MAFISFARKSQSLALWPYLPQASQIQSVGLCPALVFFLCFPSIVVLVSMGLPLVGLNLHMMGYVAMGSCSNIRHSTVLGIA